MTRIEMGAPLACGCEWLTKYCDEHHYKINADAWAQRLRDRIAAEIEQFADDDSDVSDAYRHAALIAKGTQPA
jgi:hypothetical protein